eukprot:XP_027304698.1 uncharacterized protein LOC113842222 [Anas platyrhynchos]
MGGEAQDITCPVCQGAPKEPSYILPCLHQFCFGCVMRWVQRSSTCPLCRQRITSIRYSIWAEDDFLEVQVAPDAEAQDDSPQDEQGAAEPMPQPAVRGLPPEEWAALFREHLEVLGPLRSWVRQQARELFDAAWWDQDMLEATVVAWLCRCGLDEHALVRELRPLLQGHTVSIVQRLISIMGEICSEEYLEELGFLEPRPASQLYMDNGPDVDLEGSQDTWEPNNEGSEDAGEPELEGSQDTGEPELEGSQDTWEPEDSLEATPSPAASPRTLLSPACSPPAARRILTSRSCPAPPVPPCLRVLASRPLHPSLRSRRSSSQSLKRRKQNTLQCRAAATGPLLLARAGTAHLGGPGAPEEEGRQRPGLSPALQEAPAPLAGHIWLSSK